MKFDQVTTDHEPVHRSKLSRSTRLAVDGFDGVDFPSERTATSETTIDQPQAAAAEQKVRMQFWSRRRGHGFTFTALFVYTALAYFRPYELSPSLAWTNLLPFWLALVMVAIFIPSQMIAEGRLTARPREVNLLLLLLLIALISIPQAISPTDAWTTFYGLLFKTTIVFVVTVNAMRTERRLEAMVLLALIVGGFMSISSMHKYVFGDLWVEGARARASINNMFGEPNALALHLATMIPLAIVLMLSTRNVLKKVLYIAGSLVMVAGLFATFSRGGFLALAIGMLVLFWKLGRKNRLLACALVLACLLALVLAPAGYSGRLASIFDSSKDLVGSSLARRDVLIRGIWVAISSPFLGIGIGNFHIVSIRGQVSHNSFLQVAAEMGLAALVLYCGIIVVCYRRLRSIERATLSEFRHSRFHYLSVGLQSALVAYAVGSFFLSVAYEGYLYSLVAFALCLDRLYQTDTLEEAASDRWLRGSSKDRSAALPPSAAITMAK
jgi:O-antigen ligase